MIDTITGSNLCDVVLNNFSDQLHAEVTPGALETLHGITQGCAFEANRILHRVIIQGIEGPFTELHILDALKP